VEKGIVGFGREQVVDAFPGAEGWKVISNSNSQEKMVLVFSSMIISDAAGTVPRARAEARDRKKGQIQRHGEHQARSTAFSMGQDRKCRTPEKRKKAGEDFSR
jgi:hypothetical protein